MLEAADAAETGKDSDEALEREADMYKMVTASDAALRAYLLKKAYLIKQAQLLKQAQAYRNYIAKMAAATTQPGSPASASDEVTYSPVDMYSPVDPYWWTPDEGPLAPTTRPSPKQDKPEPRRSIPQRIDDIITSLPYALSWKLRQLGGDKPGNLVAGLGRQMGKHPYISAAAMAALAGLGTEGLYWLLRKLRVI